MREREITFNLTDDFQTEVVVMYRVTYGGSPWGYWDPPEPMEHELVRVWLAPDGEDLASLGWELSEADQGRLDEKIADEYYDSEYY